MPTKSTSKTINRDPNWGSAIHPREILLEEFLKPLGLGQVEAAAKLGISLNRLNEIVLGKRRNPRRHRAAALAPAEHVRTVLDAPAGRLGLHESIKAEEDLVATEPPTRPSLSFPSGRAGCRTSRGVLPTADCNAARGRPRMNLSAAVFARGVVTTTETHDHTDGPLQVLCEPPAVRAGQDAMPPRSATFEKLVGACEVYALGAHRVEGG